jgi:hypothetical protein
MAYKLLELGVELGFEIWGAKLKNKKKKKNWKGPKLKKKKIRGKI